MCNAIGKENRMKGEKVVVWVSFWSGILNQISVYDYWLGAVLAFHKTTGFTWDEYANAIEHGLESDEYIALLDDERGWDHKAEHWIEEHEIRRLV